jgi:hypothetical protein
VPCGLCTAALASPVDDRAGLPRAWPRLGRHLERQRSATAPPGAGSERPRGRTRKPIKAWRSAAPLASSKCDQARDGASPDPTARRQGVTESRPAGPLGPRPRGRQPRPDRPRRVPPGASGVRGPRTRDSGSTRRGAASDSARGGAGPPAERPPPVAVRSHRGAHASPRLHGRAHGGWSRPSRIRRPGAHVARVAAGSGRSPSPRPPPSLSPARADRDGPEWPRAPGRPHPARAR